MILTSSSVRGHGHDTRSAGVLLAVGETLLFPIMWLQAVLSKVRRGNVFAYLSDGREVPIARRSLVYMSCALEIAP